MKRSKFSLSNYKLLSCNMGELVPCGLTEVLPGDTIQQVSSCLVRVSPLLAPMMHPVHATIHHWFVPHRLVMDDWEDFITGGPDNDDDTIFPTIDAGGSGFAVGSLADYLGCPTGVAGLDVSALPFRGYALIWNEWYRDQDLQTELVIDTTDGPDTTTSTVLQHRAWEKDYFTSSRPWPQKGPAITIPLGTTAPVKRASAAPGPVYSYNVSTNTLSGASDLGIDSAGRLRNVTTSTLQTLDPNGSLYTDLSTATGASISDLREAFALQRFAEARAQYGSRYIEYLRYL